MEFGGNNFASGKRAFLFGSSMKRLDYENPREKKNGAYANELPCGELRGQTALVGVWFPPLHAYLSTSTSPSQKFPLPCTTKRILGDLFPNLAQGHQWHEYHPAYPLDPGLHSRARPNGHALDVQDVPLVTHLLPPSPYSHRAYRLVDAVAVLNSASSVVGIERALGEVVKPAGECISS